MSELSSAKAGAASIRPAEMRHAALLSFVLGQYPVPNAFNPNSLNPIDKAPPLGDLGR